MITPRPRMRSSTPRPLASKLGMVLCTEHSRVPLAPGPRHMMEQLPYSPAAGRCASQSGNRHGGRACRLHAPAQPISKIPNPRLSPWRLRRAPAAAQSGAPRRTRPPSELPSPAPCRAAQFNQAGSVWESEMSIRRRSIQRCRFTLRARGAHSYQPNASELAVSGRRCRGQAHQADSYARHLHCPCNNVPRSR